VLLTTFYYLFHDEYSEFSDTPALLTPCQETYRTPSHLCSSSRVQLVLTTVTKPLMTMIKFPMSHSLNREKISIIQATLCTATNWPWKFDQKGSELLQMSPWFPLNGCNNDFNDPYYCSSLTGIHFSLYKLPVDPGKQKATAIGAGMVKAPQRIIVFINSLYTRWNKLVFLLLCTAFIMEITREKLHAQREHRNTITLVSIGVNISTTTLASRYFS